MGYDLHITKKDRWSDKGADISENEWIDYVSKHLDFKIVGSTKAVLPTEDVIEYKNDFLTEWNGHSKIKPVYFDFRKGHIIVKNPDDEMIEKMKEISQEIRAKVQGDEGEIY